jgi:hypothetical protein
MVVESLIHYLFFSAMSSRVVGCRECSLNSLVYAYWYRYPYGTSLTNRYATDRRFSMINVIGWLLYFIIWPQESDYDDTHVLSQ